MIRKKSITLLETAVNYTVCIGAFLEFCKSADQGMFFQCDHVAII